MELMTIKTNDHLAKLVEVAQQYEFPLESIEVVSSIIGWCKEQGIEEHNPFRTGKCLRNRETGNYKILLAEEITGEMQNSVISAMEVWGYDSEIEVLYNDRKFLLHLLLHEVAHAKNDQWSENECDSWAFAELENIAI